MPILIDQLDEGLDETINVKDYPFAQELITNTQGHILKVVINF
jgi:hypothetical protein